ncbi:hypothetical protein MKX03_033448 [Papaver bracteatum]|nr:hypothetical protein MKX03_033448 [Papaver bracteatum]
MLRCLPCCFKAEEVRKSFKKNKIDQKQRSALASFVERISFKSSNSGKQIITDEILKLGGNGNIASKTFTFRELATATKNFKPECLVGEGGFGRVYKGFIDNINQVVAVKQLDRNGLQGNREFLVEVLMLSLLHHQNLVNLIGYCADGEQRILVYEYMALGSLEDHLLVAAMCLQEEASTRPLITDVVTALEYLSIPKNDNDEDTPKSQCTDRSSLEDVRSNCDGTTEKHSNVEANEL